MLLDRVLCVAKKEYHSGVRNRIILFLTILMAFMAMVIVYFGSAARGQVGIDPSGATLVSLVSLSTYIIPIISLILGHDLIVGEIEGKTLGLILTMPTSRSEIFLGKFIGQGLSIVTVITFGMGIVIPFLLYVQGMGALKELLIFIISANLLGLSFLSLAQLASTIVDQRVKAIGLALFFWFFFVLIFDLVLVGLLVATEGHFSGKLFSFLLFFNPTDIFRIVNLFGVEEARGSFGLITLAKGNYYLISAYLGYFLWIALPLLVGNFLFKRKSL